MAHLFFSYAHSDYNRILPFFQKLELRTARMIWIDKIGLQRDAEWAAMIRRGIEDSDGVIFAITKEFVTRPFILEKEIPWAVERFNAERQGALLFPIRFDDVPIPDALNIPYVAHVIDVRDGNWDRGIGDFIKVMPPVQESAIPFIVSWPRLNNFKGRDQMLIDLHNALHVEDGKVAVKTAGMFGTGGIGKTQLAVEFAYRYRFYYPAGVYWLNAAADWQAEIAAAADRLGLQPKDATDSDRPKQKAIAFEDYLKAKGGDALIVMDNVENPALLAAREIAPKLTIPELCRQTGARLLITTREQTLPAGFQPIEVTTLAPADALAVLLDAWQPGESGQLRSDPPDEASLNAIAAAFGYLPLPLGWMAAALRQKPKLQPAALLAELKKGGVDAVTQRLKKSGVALGTPEHYAGLVDSALDWQFGQVADPNAHRLLALTAAYAEAAIVPLSRLRLLVTFDDDPLFDPFDEAIDALKKYSLIELQAAASAIRLHPLTRDYVRRKLDSVNQLAEAAPTLTAAYRDPATLHAQAAARGFLAALADLRETRAVLDSIVGSEPPARADLYWLERFFDWEAYHLQHWDAASQPAYLIQQIRERAHHQSDDPLRDACDTWLAAYDHLRSTDGWRIPNDPALLRILTGHTGTVTSAAYSPDGRHIVSASWDNTVRVWDAASGAPLLILVGHRSAVNSAAYSPDGRQIVSASADGTVRVWDAASGALLLTLTGHTDDVNSAAYSPDGRQIVSASRDNTVRVWDATSGALLRTLTEHTFWVNSAVYSPDGRYIVSASDDETVRVWDAASGAILLTLEGHMDSIYRAAYSPDGRHIVSASEDNTVRVWDAASGAPILTITGQTDRVNSAAYSPDGQQIVSASDDKTVRIWDAAIVAPVHMEAFRQTDRVNSAAYSPDGQHIVSASDDNTVRVWDAASGALLDILAEYRFVTYSPSGEIIVHRTARAWDAVNGIYISATGHVDSVISAAYSPDGQHIVRRSLENTLCVRDATSRALIHTLTGHGGYVYSAAYSPDGRHIVSASADKTVRVWDAASGALLLTLTGHTGTVNSAVYSPDGRHIVSASWDNTVRVWNATSGAPLIVLHIGASANSAAWSPDGQYIAVGDEAGRIRVLAVRFTAHQWN